MASQLGSPLAASARARARARARFPARVASPPPPSRGRAAPRRIPCTSPNCAHTAITTTTTFSFSSSSPPSLSTFSLMSCPPASPCGVSGVGRRATVFSSNGRSSSGSRHSSCRNMSLRSDFVLPPLSLAKTGRSLGHSWLRSAPAAAAPAAAPAAGAAGRAAWVVTCRLRHGRAASSSGAGGEDAQPTQGKGMVGEPRPAPSMSASSSASRSAASSAVPAAAAAASCSGDGGSRAISTSGGSSSSSSSSSSRAAGLMRATATSPHGPQSVPKHGRSPTSAAAAAAAAGASKGGPAVAAAAAAAEAAAQRVSRLAGSDDDAATGSHSSTSGGGGGAGGEGEEPEELDVYRGLVLDCAYRPINVVCWKRALCLEIAEKADVLEYYDAVVKSPNQTFPIPAVLRVSTFVHMPKKSKRKLSLSRNNIFLRDKFRCQYCGAKDNLTIDHVKALSRGGGSSWENLVTACSPCNLKKGDKSPAEAGMKLMKQPKEPRELDARELPPNYKTFRSMTRHRHTPPQWLDWLPLQPPQAF